MIGNWFATVLLTMMALPLQPGFAQEQVAAAGDAAATSPEPLNADEMEVLVARIALYPDELIAVARRAAAAEAWKVVAD